MWSKVISAGIIAFIGFFLVNIFKFDIKIFVPFFKQYYREIIIILQFLIIIIIFTRFLFLNIRKKKANICWFKRYINSAEIGKTYFLIWFLLNGIMISPPSYLAAIDNLKILHSRQIKLLIDKNIITFSIYKSVKINEKAYDILNNFINDNANKENTDERELLLKTKNTEFFDLLFECATKTDYDDD